VPREFLEQFNIQGRVQLEALEDGILIRPVGINGSGNPTKVQDGENESNVDQDESRGLRSWWKRWRGRSHLQ
jgi:hypothetical protein